MTETPQHEPEGVHYENLRDYSRLRRSRVDRKIAGVAGGLGRHLNIDPTVLRVLLVVLCFFGGAGFVLYGAAWLLVPEEGSEHAAVTTSPSTRTALLLGAAVLAAFLLVGDSWGGYHFPWPLAGIALVAFVILMKRDKPLSNQPQPPAGAVAPRPQAAQSVGATGTETLPGAGADPEQQYDQEPPAPPWGYPTDEAYLPPQPRPDRGPVLFGITLALVAVALGALGLYDVAGGSVVASAYAALALAVIGAMLVLGAWFGRAGGLVLLGLVAAFALAVTSVAHGNLRGFGDNRTLDVAPVSASAVRDAYHVPTGRIRLDLSAVRDPAALDGRTVNLDANVGEIVVVLPPHVGADVSADVSGPGGITLPDRTSGGVNTHLDQDVSSPGDVATVDLNIDLSVGHIEVRQS